MEVDFNNTRKKAVASYERLVKCLNAHIGKDPEPYMGPHVVIPVHDLKEIMDDLRTNIGFIAMVHDGDNPAFKDVFSEIFPEEKGESMTVFNPEEEDEE